MKQVEFINSLKNGLLPPTNLKIYIGLETDNMLLYKKSSAAGGTILIKNIWLCYEELTLSSANKLAYTKYVSQPPTITFYQESIKLQTALKTVRI